MLSLIIVEVGVMEDKRTPSYQFYAGQTNGTYRLCVALPDGKGNNPMFFKDAKARTALMNSTARNFAAASSLENEE